MTDETYAVAAVPLHARVRVGLRHRGNWFQLLRFVVVGASSYSLNLGVFALVFHGFGEHYNLAALAGFVVALANSFWWNRHWTFGVKGQGMGFDAGKFVLVSVSTFVFSLLVLQGLVLTVPSLPKVVDQAIALAAATPLNFLGNKLWTFAQRRPRPDQTAAPTSSE